MSLKESVNTAEIVSLNVNTGALQRVAGSRASAFGTDGPIITAFFQS